MLIIEDDELTYLVARLLRKDHKTSCQEAGMDEIGTTMLRVKLRDEEKARARERARKAAQGAEGQRREEQPQQPDKGHRGRKKQR